MKRLPVGPAEIGLLVSLTRAWTRADVEAAFTGAGWADEDRPVEWSGGAAAPHLVGEPGGWRLELGAAPGSPGAAVRLPCALFWPALGADDLESDLDQDFDPDPDDEPADDLDDEYTDVWERDEEADRDDFDREFVRVGALLRAELGEPDEAVGGIEPTELWRRDGLEIALEMTDDVHSYSHYDLIAVTVRPAAG